MADRKKHITYGGIMDYFEFRNQIYNSVTEKLTTEYGIGNLNFEIGDLLVEDLIGTIWENTQSGMSLNESTNKAFSEMRDRITALRPLTHGYIIGFSADDNGCIPYAEYVSVFRGLVGTECADECCATEFAEEDGVKLIYGLPGVPDGLYLDTEANRSIIQKYLESKTNVSVEEGLSATKSQGEEKLQLLIAEANALDDLFFNIKIYDIDIQIKGNQLIATDEHGNRWVENEIFAFALNECLTFGEDGKLIYGMDVNQEALDSVRHFAAQRGVKIITVPKSKLIPADYTTSSNTEATLNSD